MKTIPCKCGRPIEVDDDNYERLKTFPWGCCGNGKVVGYTYGGGNTGIPSKYVTISSLIVDVPKGMQPDHIDRNSHNNSRSNLRFSTAVQNSQNRGKKRGCRWRYKRSSPVIYGGRVTSWKSLITVNKKEVYLGVFPSEFEAASAYNSAALKLFGEFACLNDLTKDPKFIGPSLP